VRGLGNFKDPQAAATLAWVLKTEKDIGMRDGAYDSIRTCTGKSMPADSPQWAVYMQAGTQAGTGIQPVGGIQPAAGGAQAGVQPAGFKDGNVAVPMPGGQR
jgi:hypothetical protein